MPTLARYSAWILLVAGVGLLLRALSLIFVPTTTGTPSPTPIQSLFLERLLLAGVVLALGVVGYLLSRSRRAA